MFKREHVFSILPPTCLTAFGGRIARFVLPLSRCIISSSMPRWTSESCLKQTAKIRALCLGFRLPAKPWAAPGGCANCHNIWDFSITSFCRKHDFVQMTETRSGKRAVGWIRCCWHTSGVRSIGGTRSVVSLVPRSTTGYLPSSLWDERQDVPGPGLFSSFCLKRAVSRAGSGPGPFPPAGSRCHFLPRRAVVAHREPRVLRSGNSEGGGTANCEPELFSSFCRNWCFGATPDAAGRAALPGLILLRAPKLFSSFCRELCLPACRLGSDSRLTWKRDQQTGRWFDVIFEARFPPSFCHRQAPHLSVQFLSAPALFI